jgi:hypothetical protein
VAQHRELAPVTVYLPPEVVAELEQEAREQVSNVSAVGRRVLVEYVRDRVAQREQGG